MHNLEQHSDHHAKHGKQPSGKLGSPFQAPDDYFHGLASNVTKRVELLHSLKAGRAWEHPFVVPSGYFESLLHTLEVRLGLAPGHYVLKHNWQPARWQQLAWATSVVVCVIGLLSLGLLKKESAEISRVDNLQEVMISDPMVATALAEVTETEDLESLGAWHEASIRANDTPTDTLTGVYTEALAMGMMAEDLLDHETTRK